MNALKKALQITAYVLIILVFLVAVVFVIAAINQSNTGVSGAFGYTFSVVETDSMYPTISSGAIIIGKAVDENTEIKKGDIVTYKAQIQGVSTTITHRVTKVVTDQGSITQYETWGDNNEVADDSLRTIADIVSVYSFHIPGLGRVINFFKTTLGFVLCVVVPLVAFIVWEVIDLVKIYNRFKKDSMITEALNGASDDVKDAIIREYLAKQAEEAAKAAGIKVPADSNEKKD